MNAWARRRRTFLKVLWAVLAWACGCVPALANNIAAPISTVRVTLLSTMLVDYIGDNEGVGEWGFAALVEADGRKILFDTGAHPDTVLNNARALGIDLSDITDVVLSHFHADHTSGLVSLRRELRKRNPHAMERAHIATGFFWPRRADGKTLEETTHLKDQYLALGGTFVEHGHAEQLFPGIWLTGPVPRVTDEHNFGAGLEVLRPDGKWTADDVPDDDSLVLDTKQGLVVVTGCGHAGIINTLMAAAARVRSSPVNAIIGGLHLFASTDEHVDWTAQEMRRFRVQHLVGAHCTGIEALERLRAGAGLDRATAVQGAVGGSYTLDKGIDPGPLGLAR